MQCEVSFQARSKPRAVGTRVAVLFLRARLQPVVYSIYGRCSDARPPCLRPPAPLVLNLSRLRLLGDSRWTQGKAEAAAVEAARREAPVPGSRPTIRGLEVPTAATEHAARALTWASRIADCTLWIFFVPVAAPFPNIPMHVVKTPGIRFQKANRMCPVRTVAIKPTIHRQQTLFIIK